ncbi:TetR/AcrR family transcriptional regulator [Erwinia endophytica]|uniref:TetR/AcrR family transcriptional regulator n=1 Tax=Erwinia endophytica TaxID=1563158 RepID=UPI00186B5F6B|nr:TetR/AcrR family transcriptional regulator [Erwinia endophytica]
MMKSTRYDTREHLLITGEQLCIQRGFNGMGLIELLKVAEVPKGSFYHYFPSKEAFGVAMLERYFAIYHQRLHEYLEDHQGNQRQRILDYYQQSLTTFCQDHSFAGCLSVKLSAEVCDLSEPMRIALDNGSKALMSTLSIALERAEQQGSLQLSVPPETCAQNLYMLWLGASLQSKISRDNRPLMNAWQEMTRMLPEPL